MFDRLITFFAKQTPHALAISSLAGHVTYGELDANIDRFAAALVELNPAPRGLVGVVIADRYVHWLVLLALARMGLPSCSYMGMMAAQMEPLFKPDFVISDQAQPDRPADAAPLFWASAQWLETTGKREPLPFDRVAVDPNSLARVATSSGTTGIPKKFGMSWRGVEERITMGAAIMANTGAAAGSMSLWGPEFSPYPGDMGIWGCGGTVIFGPSDPVVLANSLTRLQPKSMFMAPMQLKALLDALPEGFLPMTDLWLSVSGSHTPDVIRKDARLRLTPHLVLSYGSTEGGGIALRPDLGAQTDDADVGTLMPWTELEVVDDADQPVPHGALGQIRVRGPMVVDGYLDDPEATAKFFRNGWFYPGDVGSRTAGGQVRVEGRVDDVMNFGGGKFMPHTIEGAVMACAGVTDAGAFTLPDPATGFDTPWIAVVRGEGLVEQEIAQALGQLPGLPASKIVWTDVIPRTPTGKVKRDVLQAAVRERDDLVKA